MKLTHCAEALISLQLQYNHHMQEQTTVNLRKLNAEMESRKLWQGPRAESRNLDEQDPSQPNSLDPRTEELQNAIYKAIEDQDSLLQFLYRSPEVSKNYEQVKSREEIIRSASKTPKDDKTVIEELKVNNNELKKLIDNLMKELESCHAENIILKETIKNMTDSKDTRPKSELVLPPLDTPKNPDLKRVE